MVTILRADENLCEQSEVYTGLIPTFKHLHEVCMHLGIHFVFIESLRTPTAYAFSFLVSPFAPSANIEEEEVVVLVDKRFVRALTSLDEIRDCFLDVASVVKVELDHLRGARLMIDWCVDFGS